MPPHLVSTLRSKPSPDSCSVQTKTHHQTTKGRKLWPLCVYDLVRWHLNSVLMSKVEHQYDSVLQCVAFRRLGGDWGHWGWGYKRDRLRARVMRCMDGWAKARLEDLGHRIKGRWSVVTLPPEGLRWKKSHFTPITETPNWLTWYGWMNMMFILRAAAIRQH